MTSVLDGRGAIDLTEAAMSTTTLDPRDVAGSGPRAKLAAAMGVSMSGERATVHLTGPELLAGVDLLMQASGRHLPLVAHLSNRAATAHAVAVGTGHEAYHAAAGCGWIQLLASDVQEAVDLTLVARRVAEKALVPALVAMDPEPTTSASQEVVVPDESLVEQLIGDPRETIDVPTDAQRLIFGETRRRVPRWYDLDRPQMLGPVMGPECWALGAAGTRVGFESAVPSMLAEAFDRLGSLTGRSCGPVFEHELKRAEIVLVAQGAAVETAAAAADLARRHRRKVGVLGVRCLRPLPAGQIASALRGARVVAVLERVDGALGADGPLLTELRAHVRPDRGAPHFVGVPYGLGGLPLHVSDLVALVETLRDATPERIYLGLEFTRDHSDYPKHQALLDTLRRSDPDLTALGLRRRETEPDRRPRDRDAGAEPPAVVRRIRSLPRFWDHVGVLYRDGRTDELVAEPGLAAGTAPPLTAALRTLDDAAPETILVFDPSTCDGDRALWTTCPDGSVAALVISSRGLLDAGIDLAARRGRPVDALRRIAAKLARAADKAPAATTADALFREAFTAVGDDALAAALDAVLEEIGELPVAKTDVFPDELLALVVNPDTCRCPELVIAATGGRGLTAVPRTPEAVATARRLWRLWERLPDTSGATIARAREQPEIGPLAACLLSRHCAQTMAGADDAEPGSGAKLALRRVLALTEYHLQPRLQQHLEEVGSLRRRLGDAVRDVLAEALPADDLDALAEGLEVLGRGDVDLAELSGRVDSAVTGGRVDGARLARLVEIARNMADLEWHLRDGPSGAGRARVGLTLTSDSVTGWSAKFPYQPFASPVVVDAVGEAAPLARGLLVGQLRQTLAGLHLMRRARAELDEAEPPPEITYADLDEKERALCPPILLVGDDHAFAGRGLSALVGLLESGLPVTVVCLSDPGVRSRVLQPAALATGAFVAETSLADDDHFARSVESALAFPGPALVVIPAPSPKRDGFAPEQLLEQVTPVVEEPVETTTPTGPEPRVDVGVDVDLDALRAEFEAEATERVAQGLLALVVAAEEANAS